MKKAVLLLILISYLLLNVSIYGQQEVITWEKKFGDRMMDKAYCIQQTNDGGYIVAEMPPFSGQKEVNNIIKYINILSYYYS